MDSSRDSGSSGSNSNGSGSRDIRKTKLTDYEKCTDYEKIKKM